MAQLFSFGDLLEAVHGVSGAGVILSGAEQFVGKSVCLLEGVFPADFDHFVVVNEGSGRSTHFWGCGDHGDLRSFGKSGTGFLGASMGKDADFDFRTVSESIGLELDERDCASVGLVSSALVPGSVLAVADDFDGVVSDTASALVSGRLPLDSDAAAIGRSGDTLRRLNGLLAEDFEDMRELALSALGAGSDLELVHADAFDFRNFEAGLAALGHNWCGLEFTVVASVPEELVSSSSGDMPSRGPCHSEGVTGSTDSLRPDAGRWFRLDGADVASGGLRFAADVACLDLNLDLAAFFDAEAGAHEVTDWDGAGVLSSVAAGVVDVVTFTVLDVEGVAGGLAGVLGLARNLPSGHNVLAILAKFDLGQLGPRRRSACSVGECAPLTRAA